MKKCISRQFHGGSEAVTFEEFALYVIQDDVTAANIAQTMLEQPGREYPYNEDQPEFYETFLVVDADALQEQLLTANLESD